MERKKDSRKRYLQWLSPCNWWTPSAVFSFWKSTKNYNLEYLLVQWLENERNPNGHRILKFLHMKYITNILCIELIVSFILNLLVTDDGGWWNTSKSVNEWGDLARNSICIDEREEFGLDSSHKSKTKMSFVPPLIVVMMLPYRGIDSDFFVFCFH